VFEDRVAGCLIGAAIGAELGFGRHVHGDRYQSVGPADLFGVKLEPALDHEDVAHRVDIKSITAFIDVGVRAYLRKNGRVTPEDFAAVIVDDAGLAAPAFLWDDIHTTQELLLEGMNPRISGLGTAPSGKIAAAMPAVGIFHAGDPEYAYLDGVELASVAQPRLGADWAALCAAAVASALAKNASPESIRAATLRIAHQNNKELFYQINQKVNASGGSEEDFLASWFYNGGRPSNRNDESWISPNPIAYVLPVLSRYADNPEKLFAVLFAAPANWGACMVSPAIAGAIVGALHGAQVFPEQWREWAEPIAKNWLPLADVVKAQAARERVIVKTVEDQVGDGGKDSRLFDKIHGCILAGAIGNAMGSPVENSFYWEIDKKYPGGITTILNTQALESEDDNQMAMLLTETYLEREGLPVMARHFGKTWFDRLNRNHFFPQCMGNAYDLIRSGWDPRIVGHWSQVTGSTVMCMEPVGIYHAGDPENAAIDATAISYMYQRGLDVTAAAIIAAATAEALKADATVDSVCQAALDAAPRGPFKTFDKRAFGSVYDYFATCMEIAGRYDDVLAVRPELYEKCLLYHAIDPIELLGFSLAMLKVADGDVRQAAIGGTNIGRDSDTIAGRGAMLAGTLKGASCVPEEWIALFKPEVLGKIERTAARLTELVSVGRGSRLRGRAAGI
jgi:ADP-ribosylglycohydrolase